jgi:lysozyme-like protein
MSLAGRRWLPREIVELCWKAGWRDLNLLIMVACVLQESEGYAEAVGGPNSDGSYDLGIFQLTDSNSKVTKEIAFDPNRAVKIARELFEERGFQPWVAFKTERYLQKGPGKDYMLRSIEGVRNYWRVRYGYPIAG